MRSLIKPFFLTTFLILFSTNGISAELQDFELPIYKSKETFNLNMALKENDKILINFWASWCTGCIQELAELLALKEKYKDQKVLFIAINAGESKKKIKKFIKKYKFSYLVLLDKDRVLSKGLGVNNLPKTIVVNKKREILFTGNRPPKEI